MKKILVIDDDAFLSSIYITKLQSEGYEVLTAKDGEEGIVAAKKGHPDAILLDILMPKKDGFETLSALKASPATRDIPVLMLTSLGQKEDIDRGLSGGAADFLIKTQTLPGDAVEKIRKIIG